MIIIGLTGATGAGKGCFSRALNKEFGITHIDTDLVARSVVQPGKPCLADIKNAFGDKVINPDGTLCRRALGEIVFSDKQKLQLLNSITHHYITDEVLRIIEAAKKSGEQAVIIDAPLLFESGEDRLCHVTVGVVANKDIRKKRIIQRDGIDEKMADSRIDNGKDEEYFRERCDYILENNGDESELYQKACLIWKEISNNQNIKNNSEKI